MNAREKPVSFAALKQSISISQVLDRYGLLQHLHRSGNSLSGPCPLHAGHNPTQFRVSLSKNCWVCFGDCQAGGSILDFVSRKEGISIRAAAVLLDEWFGGSLSTPQAQRTAPPPPRPVRNRVLRFVLRVSASHPYLAQRNLAAETIQTFGVGYCAVGTMAGRIAIPIHNGEGDIVAYAGRWPGTPPRGTPKYLLPAGFRKSLELFNAHRAVQAADTAPLVLVEGFFGCMAVWQAGFRRVVALMGSSLSDAQKQCIVRAAPRSGCIDLLFDEDASGRTARERIRARLAPQFRVRVIAFPAEGLQPDRVSPETLCALLA